MRITAVFISALLYIATAHAGPSRRELADKVAKEFDAEHKMSSTDQPAQCRALYKVISGLDDITSACSVDRPFMEKTYKPLAISVSDEAPRVCPAPK
jgi:hypothetical protein